MARAFVTGSTGLLGNNLVRALRGRGHEVRALVRSPDKAATQLPDDVELVRGDLGDVAAFADALDGCDLVFHTAAYFREYFGPGEHDADLRRLNVDATVALLEAADRRGVRTFVHTSSSGVVGRAPDGGLGDETTAPPPIASSNRYFASKVEAERAVDAFTARHDLHVVVVRPGWMFGPGDAAPTSAGQVVLDVVRGRLPGTPRTSSTTVDARDVAAAMVAAADKGAQGERYNLAGPVLTMGEVARAVAAAAGVRAPRELPDAVVNIVAVAAESLARISGRPAMVTRKAIATLREGAAASSAKAERELGFAPRPFAQTARDTVAWYRAAGMLAPA